MDNNNLRNPSVPYTNGGVPPQPVTQASAPLFADVARSTGSAATQATATPIAAPVSVASQPTGLTPLSPATPPLATAPQLPSAPKKPRDWRKIVLSITLGTLFLLFIGAAWLIFEAVRNNGTATTPVNNQIASTTIPLSDFASSGSLNLLGTQSLAVNGQLRANESFVLAPQTQPGKTERGQLYFDANTNQLAYYNGSQFVQVAGVQDEAPTVLTLQGQTGNITLVGGAGIAVNGTTLVNTGITSVGTATGDITLGSGITIVDGTLSNTGVIGATGGTGISVVNDGSGNITISNTGSGTGTVTSPNGTAGRIAKFTGLQTIEDSLLSESGATVTVNGNLSVTGTTTLSTALGVNSGGTGATTFTANGVIVGNGSGALTAVAAGGVGECLISTAGAPSFQACPGGSGGVTALNSLTGSLTIANASTAGSTITINDASTSQKGIAQFNSTNFSAASGVINTVQNINVAATPTFGALTLTSSQATSPMLLVNNTNGSGSGNLIDLQLGGATRFAISPAGTMTVTGTVNGQTISSSANFTGTLTVAGTTTVNGAANLTAGATVTGTLTANTITPSGAMTIGSTGQSLTLQGNASTTLSATNSGNTSTLSFQTPTANVNYRLLTAAAGTYDICTTVGNCVGVGGSVTTAGGTTNQLAKFTGSNAIGDSIISDNGSTVSIGGVLAVNTITPTGALTVGSISQALTLQGTTTTLSSTDSGVTNTLSFATPAAGNKNIVIPNASGTVVVSASGPLAIDSAGNVTCSTCATTSTSVTSLNGLSGVLSLAYASGSGNTITIQDASTTQKGVAQFNSTNFSVSSGIVNTIQNIDVAATPTFGRLTVTSSQASNAMLLINNTNTGASGNLLDVQLNGTSRLAVTPAGAMTLTGTLNGQTISSTANFTGTLAVAGVTTINGAANLTAGATVTGTLTANTITPSSSLTVGATNQSFLMQGNASSTITATSGANTTTVAFQTPTASVTYRLLTASAGTYDICTTVGNCAGVGGGVTTAGGTTNQLAKFTGSNAIGDSIISDNGSTVTIGGTLAVNTISPTAAMTIGATSQNLTLQGAVTTITSTNSGTTNSLTFATPAGGNKTITLPNATGTVAVSATGPLSIDANGNITCSTCVTSGGGGGGVGAVDSLNGLTGALTIANSSGSGSTITIDDASTSQKGIAQFNSTNFSASSGVINTIQNINTTAAPTFGQLTLTSSQASAAMLTVNNTNVAATGNLIDLQLNGSSRFSVNPAGAMIVASTINGQTISSSANFTGTLAVASTANLNGGATVSGTLTANTITPSSSLTVGATGQSFLLQGNASSTITATNSGSTTTLAFQTPTANVTYRLLTATAGTYDVCTTVGNCAGIGGGVTTAGGTSGKIAKFTGSGTIADSIITESGSVITVAGTTVATTAVQAPLFDTASSGTLSIGTTNATAINLNQNTVLAAGKSLTITGGNTASRPGSPTEGMVYYDTTTKSLLTYSNGKWQSDRSTANKIVAMGSPSSCSGNTPVASQNPDGADYTVSTCTDADSVINSAITALPTGGGTVYLMDGTYIIDGTINIPSNVTLTGAGAATTIKLRSSHGSAISLIQNSNTVGGNTRLNISNFRISGGGNASITGVYLENVGSGFGSALVQGATIADMYLEDLNYSVYLAGASTHNTIRNTSITSTSYGVYDYSSNYPGGNNLVTNNKISSAIYPLFSGAYYGSNFTDNELTGCSSSNGCVYLNSTGNKVSNNSLTMTSVFHGIFGNGSDNYISNNYITGGGSSGAAIFVYSASGWTITGNTIRNVSGKGIELSSASKTIVDGNTITAAGGSGSLSSIVVSTYSSTPSSQNQITNNMIADTAGTGYAIDIQSSQYGTYLSNNRYSGTGATSINDSGTGTIYANQLTNGGKDLSVVAPSGFAVGKSTATSTLNVQGAYVSNALPTPSAPTLSTVGTAGSTSYTYAVVANDGLGDTLASTGTTITTGNATLNGTNYNRVTITPVSGAVSYKVYRTASSGSPSSTGLIGTVSNAAISSSTIFNDTGLAASGSTPVANTTGGMSLAGNLQGTTASLQDLTLSGDIAVNGGDITSTAATLNMSATSYVNFDSAVGFIFKNSGNNRAYINGQNGRLEVYAANSFGGMTITGSGGNEVFVVQGDSSAVNIGYSDTVGTLLVLDTKTNSGDPTGTNGGMYYNSNSGKFRCYEAGSWVNCINSSGSSATLQTAYNNSTNPELTLDSTRGALTVRDNATPLAANLFEVQNNGGTSTYLAVAATGTSVGGPLTVQPASDGVSLTVKSSAGNNVLTVDTTNSRVGIGLSGGALPVLSNGGLEVNGALRLSGSGSSFTDVYTTPVGSSVNSKIVIPNQDPGAFGQLVAIGLPSSAQLNARALSLFDARTSAHQPTIGVFSPDENNLFGFSWEGSNTSAYIKTTGSNLILRNNSTDLMTLLSGGNVGIGVSPSYKLDVAGSVNVSSGNSYKINGTDICTASGCTPAAGSSNYIQNGTSVQTANMAIQSGADGSRSLVIRARSSQTAETLRVENNSGTSQFAISAAGDVTAANKITTGSFAGAGLSDCDASNSKLLWDATTSLFSCGTDRASVTIRKAATETVTTNTTAQNDDDFFFSAGANETWAFQMFFEVNGSATADFRAQVDAPTGSTCRVAYNNIYNATNTYTSSCGNAGENINDQGDTFDNSYIVYGTVVTSSTSGTIRLKWAQGTSSGSTSIIAGGQMIAYKISGADLAEAYYTNDQSVMPGDVVQVDGSLKAGVKKTDSKYSQGTLGVVSTKPGLILGEPTDALTSNGKPVLLALNGRVPVKVSLENGAIRAGDYLTASSTPGVAMKATKPGQMIGTALEDYTGESSGSNGTTMVFVNPIWATPDNSGLQVGAQDSDLQGQNMTNFESVNINGKLTVRDTLTVDPENKRITVGPANGDDYGTILVLGNRNVAGDPEGSNGAMYYNAANRSFRCYSSGAWGDCSGGRYAQTNQGSQGDNTPPNGNTITSTTPTPFLEKYSVPAGDCTPGKSYRITAGGNYSTARVASGYTMSLMWGGTAIATTGSAPATTPAAVASQETWSLNAIVTCYKNFSGAIAAETNGTVSWAHPTDESAKVVTLRNAQNGQSIVTTSAQNLGLKMGWVAEGDSITLRTFVVEAIGQ